jgi:hypothetical protein
MARLFTVVAVCLMLAGCGGSMPATSASSSPVNAVEAYFQAVIARDPAAICARSSSHLHELFAAETGASTCLAAATKLIHRKPFAHANLTPLRHAVYRLLSQTATSSFVQETTHPLPAEQKLLHAATRKVSLLVLKTPAGWLYDGRPRRVLNPNNLPPGLAPPCTQETANCPPPPRLASPHST